MLCVQASCNSQPCGRDGGDCIPRPPDRGNGPWANCPHCRMLYRDGQCNKECNTMECLYDGGDCAPSPGECEEAMRCVGVAGDGRCQKECYTSLCPFDGQDCAHDTESGNDFVSASKLCVCPPNC